MIIYTDTEYKCYPVNDGTMTEVEEPFFDGKCPDFVKGYKRVPEGAEYEGGIAAGTMIFPWRPYAELEKAQLKCELELLRSENAEYEAALSEIEAALEVEA